MHIKRIRDLREDNDLTQKELGRRIGINQQNYSRYESGERTFPVDKIIRIADIFNVSIDYLLGRTDKKEINK